MDDRVMQFRVGVVVVATVIIAAILLVLFGEVPKLGWGRGAYTLSVNFREAPGVAKDTPVQKNGILIGRVTDVGFTDDGGVVVTVAIDDNVRIRKSERCRVKTSLFGDAVLEFSPGRGKVAEDFFADGDSGIPGDSPPDILQAASTLQTDIARSLSSFDSAATKVANLAESLDRWVTRNDQQVQRIMTQAETSMKSFDKAMASVDRVIGDPALQDDLRAAFKDLPELLKETQKTIAGIQTTTKLAEENLTQLKGFTEPLGKNGPEIIDNINGSVKRLDELLAQMVGFSKALNSQEGSLGQLLHNPELYQNMNRATQNIEDASRQLEPILRDVRIFADTIARHPGAPLRDAVKPGPGVKGYAPQP